MMKNMLKDYGNFEEKKTMKIKEAFEYEGELPIKTMMEVMTDEWQDYNKGLFGESSHYEDEAMDEDKYLQITAIVPFSVGEGYSFNNKKVDKEYSKEVNDVYVNVDGDADEYFDELLNYEDILFTLIVDLKDEIMFADVDLGNGLSTVEVAREKLPTTEDEFRKAVKRMIEAF